MIRAGCPLLPAAAAPGEHMMGLTVVAIEPEIVTGIRIVKPTRARRSRLAAAASKRIRTPSDKFLQLCQLDVTLKLSGDAVSPEPLYKLGGESSKPRIRRGSGF